MGDTEIELKLSLTAKAADKLRRDKRVRKARTGPETTERLVAVYFDTADGALAAAGIALRVRQEGGRYIQTVKTPIGPARGVQTRREVNAEVDGPAPVLARIPDATAARRVRRSARAGDLAAIFTTDVTRTTWTLAHGGSTVELALDSGEIRAGGLDGPADAARTPISEAELELVAGHPADLIALAERLAKRVPVRIGPETKAARGYRLHTGAAPAPETSVDPALTREMTAGAAFQAILGAGTRQLLANTPAVLDGTDPEGVHQARVGVRRLRAALSAFKPELPATRRKPAAKRLRWLQQALGPARDWDVFIAETLGPVRKAAPDHAGLADIAARAEARRDEGYAAARKALGRKRAARAVLELEAWRVAEAPAPAVDGIAVEPFARELLEMRYAAVLADGGDDPGRLADAALHALRIEIKKLRYATEFFGALYEPATVKAFLQACKKLQDGLGSLNDAAVARRLLRELAGGADDPADVLDADAVARIDAHHEQRVAKDLKKLASRWRRFTEAPAFWRAAGTDRAAAG